MNILFQGDSITDAGRDKDCGLPNDGLGTGYVTMVAGRLLSERDDVNIYNRGIYGNRTEQIAARWDKDALSIDYDVLSLLCGINDVGFDLRMGIRGDRAFVEPIYDKIIYQTKEKNPDAKLILMTPFVMKMHFDHPEFGDDIFEKYEIWNERAVIAGEITKEMAKKYGAELVPLFDIFKELVKTNPVENYSVDCVHPTSRGHAIIAREWLSAFDKFGI